MTFVTFNEAPCTTVQYIVKPVVSGYIFYSEREEMAVTTPTATTESSQPPTFETVWALLKEVAEKQKETDRQLKESREEADRQLKESRDDFYLRLGRLTNLFGEFTIGEMSPMLHEKFNAFGFNFTRSNINVLFDDYVNDIHFEIDILLENGEKAVLVEVKTKLTKDRITKHIERLEKMRRYSNLRGDKRLFLGAVAGFTIAPEEKNMALNEGLYVIEPSGDNFNITPPNGEPREW